ncbi:MAG: formylglycine-generating enzyme family protein [Myxococcota bacterium]
MGRTKPLCRPGTLALAAALAFLCIAATGRAGAEVGIETVPVGNPGNPGDQPRLPCCNDPTAFGAVGYPFWIGTHEVTAGQYTAFLNAVAASDPRGLYHPWMDYDADPGRRGCNIQRQGAPGSYTYSVAPDWADRPVNYVSWADAARFANWLHNGQPTGAQDLTTTEDGAYLLDGIFENDDDALEDVLREPDATWAIASEHELYKAAYHPTDGATGNYWSLPTRADVGASNALVDPDPGNHATFTAGQVLTIGAPYYRTEVGAHENSASDYGSFDQGGNVMEFTEAVPEPDIRRIRGGSWKMAASNMAGRSFDDVMHSSDQFDDLGFRVVTLVEPAGPASVPALPAGGVPAALLGTLLAGRLALRPRRRTAG